MGTAKTKGKREHYFEFNEEATREKRLMEKNDDGEEVEDVKKALSERLVEALSEIKKVNKMSDLKDKLLKYNAAAQRKLVGQEKKNYIPVQLPEAPEIADEV